MKTKKVLGICCSAVMLLAAAGCTPQGGTAFNSDDYVYEREQGTSTMLKFSSSDEGLDNFLNDYLHRHLRYDDMRIGSLSLGASVMFNKEWEAMSLMYFDSQTSVPDDRYAMIKDWTSNVPVDKYGYVWSNKEELQPNYFSAATYFGQGWPFPDYSLSGGESMGWEWDDNDMAEGWEVRLNGNQVTPSVVSGLISIENSRIETVEFTSDPQTTYLVPKHSPFLEIDIRLNDFTNIGATSGFDDIIVEWKKGGSDEWYQVSYKDFATYATNIGATFNKKFYLPMYLNPNWGTSDSSQDAIRQIRITVKAKDGVKVNGGVKMNYVRGQYDTRQTNNNALLLRAAKMYYEFTGDNEYLAQNLVRFRKAAEFLIDVCGGSDGLISMRDFFVGHEGATNKEIGSSIGNGYWDIISCAPDGFYTNIYYYKAIESMLYLEEMAKAAGIEAEMPTVYNGDYSSGEEGSCTYDQTTESLNELLGTIRTAIQAPVDTTAKTGFWDADKGRFIEGFDSNGAVIDYGFIMFNLEAVAAGVCTDEQATRIMDWVSGKRIIEEDAASAPGNTPEDKEGNYASGYQGTRLNEDGSFADTGTLGIYDFEFAPRSTTVKNYNQYVWNWGGTNEFGGQVQDGGAIMYLSYYDLMSRLSTYGADDAFDRLKGIQTWYEKVKAVADEANIDETAPKNFYREYYSQRGIIMQGAGTAGGIGLDEEFLESALLLATIPYGFFGIDSSNYNVLSITPSLPSSLNWWKMENLRYHDVNYDLSVGKDFVQISYVKGFPTGLQISVTLPKAEGQQVYVDGVATTDYVTQGNMVTVTVPFKACKVQVK